MAVYVAEELVRRDEWLGLPGPVREGLRDKIANKMVRTGVLPFGARGEDIGHAAEIVTLTYCKAGKGSKMVAARVESATHVLVRLEVLMGEGEPKVSGV